jgi:hypothetical protein
MKGGVWKSDASGVAPRVLFGCSGVRRCGAAFKGCVVGFERHTANKFNSAAWASFIGATFGKEASIGDCSALQQMFVPVFKASPMPTLAVQTCCTFKSTGSV